MNLPDEIEFYTHRSGRTARAGKTGISIAIITRKEVSKIRQIEKAVQTKFEKKEVPTGVEVCEKRVLNIVARLREVPLAEKEIGHFLPAVFEELKDLSKEEIIKRFTALEFNHFLDYYRDAPDLNRSDKSDRGSDRGERGETYRGAGGGDRLFINLGKMDGFDAGKMLGMICDRAKVSREVVGRIDLKGAYSFIEVEKEFTNVVREHLHGFEYKGRMVRIEITSESGGDSGSSRGGQSRDRGGRSDRGGSRDSRGGSGGGRDRKKSRY
jgi:ATP-dependent RNA helicase DeaD